MKFVLCSCPFVDFLYIMCWSSLYPEMEIVKQKLELAVVSVMSRRSFLSLEDLNNLMFTRE
jgi:hypothetical protein